MFCALDIEMNGNYPLAVALVKGFRVGDELVITESKLFTISQSGRPIDYYVRKYIVTDEALWKGTDTCKDAVLYLLEATEDVDTIFTWGREGKLLSKLITCAGMVEDIRCSRLLHLITNVQNKFKNPKKLQHMFDGRATELKCWHNPLTDATSTLELALLHFEK